MKYRFVGSEASLAGGTIACNRLGQVVELAEPDTKAPLITEAQFASCGFTAEELAQYGYHLARENAPPAFMAKLRKAWALVGVKEVAAEPAAKKGKE